MRICIVLIALALAGCKADPPTIEGGWTVSSKFYKANYEIKPEEGRLVGVIMDYDDDTYRYHHNANKPRYVFTNLVQEGEYFVDASQSGPGRGHRPRRPDSVKMIEVDTLVVTRLSHFSQPLQ